MGIQGVDQRHAKVGKQAQTYRQGEFSGVFREVYGQGRTG